MKKWSLLLIIPLLFLVAAGCMVKKPNPQLEQARKYILEEKYNLALNILVKVIKEDPTTIPEAKKMLEEVMAKKTGVSGNKETGNLDDLGQLEDLTKSLNNISQVFDKLNLDKLPNLFSGEEKK